MMEEKKVTSGCKVKIIGETSPISREQGDFPALPYYGWPSVAVDEKDVTYAVVSKRLLHIDPYGRVMLYKSTDRGRTWDEGSLLMNTVLDDRDAGIVYLGNGRLLVTTFSHDAGKYVKNDVEKWVKWQELVGEKETQAVFDRWEGIPKEELRGRSSYLISDDYGKTWSEPRIMPISAPHGPGFGHGKAVYVGTAKAPELTGKNLGDGIYCCVSEDRGETWQEKTPLPVERENWTPVEPHAIPLRDGSILAAVRENNKLHTLICRSVDGGMTWTEPEDLGRGIPPHLLELSDGTVVLSYAARGKKEKGEFVRFSRDGGKSWSEEAALSLIEDPEHYVGADIGYPATAEYSDGTLITVFYQVLPGDKTPSLARCLWKPVR